MTKTLNLDYLNSLNILPPTADIISSFELYQSPPMVEYRPTNITNPYYEWIVRHNLSPFDLAQIFNLKCVPLWGMGRLGQSETPLPDGRVILIGGEYEDHYDPQFYIYHDVIIKHPDGKIDIFVYPKAMFNPTDFHSATLIGEEIYVIGGVGYVNDRNYKSTPIYKLNIHSLDIKKIESRNHIGLIGSHTAILKDNQIIIKGGQILSDDNTLMDNIDDWAFNPNTLTFKNLTNHVWQGFMVQRKDFHWLSLFDYHCLLFDRDYNPDEFEDKFNQLTNKLGIEPNLTTYQQIFIPPIYHHQDQDDKSAIWIDGIKIRYVDNLDDIGVYIEGQLSDDKVQLLADNLCYKLSKLENTPCQIQFLPFHTPLGVIKKKAKKIKRV